MKQPPPISLQKKLVKSSVLSSVFAGLLAFLILLGLSIYQTMKMHDEIMDEVSDMLLISDVSSTSGQQVDELSSEFQVYYQLQLDHMVLINSEGDDVVMELPATPTLGFDYLWHDQQLWRTYTATDEAGELSTFLMQPLKKRFIDIFKSVGVYLGILILVWLLQWLIVHYLIKKQFKSIQRLSEKISEKTAHDLTPIVAENTVLELQPMINQLNLMLGRLEQSLLAEQRFTADASHELRSPLSAIKMRLQLLQRKYKDEPTFTNEIMVIQQDIDRGVNVLENLLLLARLDPSLSQDLPKQNIELKALVNDVLNAVKLLGTEKNVDWQLELQEVQLSANRELLFSCVRNLVDNAIRYLQPHGRIKISLTQQKQQIYLTIEDNGQQLTDDVLSHMGERFYRALGTKTQGSGLGLSICKKIVALHQGQIKFSRSDLGGLKVSIVLAH